MARNGRSLFVLPLIVFLFSIFGGIYSTRVHAAAVSDNAAGTDVMADIGNFTKFYSLVEQNFAVPVSPDKAIYDGAIPGMLATLDPHSTFFDPRAFRLLQDDQ